MRAEAHVNEVRAYATQILNAYNGLRGLIEEAQAKGYSASFAATPETMGQTNADDGVTPAVYDGGIAALTAVFGTQMTNAQRTALYKLRQ